MPRMYLTIALILVSVALMWLIPRRALKWYELLGINAVVIVFGLLVLGSSLLVEFVVVASLAIAIGTWLGGPHRIIGGVVFVLTLIATMIQFEPSYARLHKRAELRAEFPIVSLAPRLSYETAHRSNAVPSQTLPETIEQNFTEMEQTQFSQRSFLLANLHDQHLDEFLGANGFGIARARYVQSRREVLLPEVSPVSLPPLVCAPQPDSSSGDPNEPPPVVSTTVIEEKLAGLHMSSQKDFLDQDRLGYIVDVDHVAGFVPHRLTQVPETGLTGRWQITSLQLVSLLKHAQPRVYVSEHLPQMELLAQVPTRPLDAFESKSLEQLEHTEDRVVEQSPDVIRMVASLRAGTDCLKCHQVQRGELLGAFSYVLERVQTP